MITVFSVVTDHCIKNELSVPSKNDLTNLGNMISSHFRKKWVPKQNYQQNVIIPGSGMMIQQEPDGPRVVIVYPDLFLPDMQTVISDYYKTKGQPRKPEGEKKRKRIPLSGPVASTRAGKDKEKKD